MHFKTLNKQSHYSAEAGKLVKVELSLLFVQMEHPHEGPSLFLGGRRGSSAAHSPATFPPQGRVFSPWGVGIREKSKDRGPTQHKVNTVVDEI